MPWQVAPLQCSFSSTDLPLPDHRDHVRWDNLRGGGRYRGSAPLGDPRPDQLSDAQPSDQKKGPYRPGAVTFHHLHPTPSQNCLDRRWPLSTIHHGRLSSHLRLCRCPAEPPPRTLRTVWFSRCSHGAVPHCAISPTRCASLGHCESRCLPRRPGRSWRRGPVDAPPRLEQAREETTEGDRGPHGLHPSRYAIMFRCDATQGRPITHRQPSWPNGADE